MTFDKKTRDKKTPKIITVTKPMLPDFREYADEIQNLFKTARITNMGSLHNQLESMICHFLSGTENECGPNTVLFANGHTALEAAVTAMELPSGSEIITTPFTFISTTNAIIRCGHIPVFCDIRESDYTLDPKLIEPLINERTSAIIPVHVYGNFCDTDAIEKLAEKYGLRVIYDAAHTFGTKVNGKSAAKFGDAAVFSFHATKVFNTVEGGAVYTRDPDIAERLCALRNFGIDKDGEFRFAGGNAKMSEFHAAMGICNLNHIDEEIATRRKLYECYIRRLSNIGGIKLCEAVPGAESNYAYFPVVFDGFRKDRDEIARRLESNGITARKYFYPLTSSAKYCKDFPASDPVCTPVASHISSRVLTLPIHSGLCETDVCRICDIILS